MKLYRRLIDVETTSCVYWVFASAILISEKCNRSIESINGASEFHFSALQNLINVTKFFKFAISITSSVSIPKNGRFLIRFIKFSST